MDKTTKRGLEYGRVYRVIGSDNQPGMLRRGDCVVPLSTDGSGEYEALLFGEDAIRNHSDIGWSYQSHDLDRQAYVYDLIDPRDIPDKEHLADMAIYTLVSILNNK